MSISFLKCMAGACSNVITTPSVFAFVGGLSLGLAGALGLVERTTQAASNTLAQNRGTIPPEAGAESLYNLLINRAREITNTAKDFKRQAYFLSALCWLPASVHSLDYPYSTTATSAICLATGCFLGAGAALLVAEKGTQWLVNRFIQMGDRVLRTTRALEIAHLVIDPIQAAANNFKKAKQAVLATTVLFGTALCLGIGISNGCSPFSLASRNFSSIGTGKKVLN